ncbi:MAG: SAM-dependent methyltransferase, partial [Candidatus Binatia bacterium]
FASRLAFSLALLIALGFLLGLPFPTALASLGAGSQALVAWAIGVNGFASVIAGTLAVPAAMIGGFRALGFLAAFLYAVAAVVAPLESD